MFSLFKKKAAAPAATIVVPRIKNENFLKAVSQVSGMAKGDMPIMEKLAGDLILTYAIDAGNNYEMVSEASIEKYKLPKQELLSLAKINALPALRSLKTRNDGIVYELTAPDGMAACSIIFPQLWDQIEQQIGGAVVAMFPHRDVVLFAQENRSDAIDALKKVSGQVNIADTHALSKMTYRRIEGAWYAE